MRSTKDSITLPLLRHRAEPAAIGCMVMLFVPLLALMNLLFGAPLWELLEAVPMMLVMTAVGAYPLLLCFLRLHLVPEGTAVSLFGRTIIRYRAEKLTVIRWDVDQTNGPRLDRLCLSALSVEELAALREQKLRKSVFDRDIVDRRKLRGDWQQVFAMEQVRAMTRLGPVFPAGRHTLCLQATGEIDALLELAYPNAACLDLRRRTKPPSPVKTRCPVDDPGGFRRCHVGVRDPAGMPLLLGCFLIPSLILMLLGAFAGMFREHLSLAGSILAVVWMFGSLGYMAVFRLGNDRVIAEETGIRIVPKGRKSRLVPVRELKSVWRIRLDAQGGALSYLVFCRYTSQELLRMEELRLSRTRWGREELSALRLLEDWPRLAVRRYLCHRAAMLGYDDPRLLLVGRTEDRERWIAEQYPQLEVIDLTD